MIYIHSRQSASNIHDIDTIKYYKRTIIVYKHTEKRVVVCNTPNYTISVINHSIQKGRGTVKPTTDRINFLYTYGGFIQNPFLDSPFDTRLNVNALVVLDNNYYSVQLKDQHGITVTTLDRYSANCKPTYIAENDRQIINTPHPKFYNEEHQKMLGDSEFIREMDFSNISDEETITIPLYELIDDKTNVLKIFMENEFLYINKETRYGILDETLENDVEIIVSKYITELINLTYYAQIKDLCIIADPVEGYNITKLVFLNDITKEEFKSNFGEFGSVLEYAYTDLCETSYAANINLRIMFYKTESDMKVKIINKDLHSNEIKDRSFDDSMDDIIGLLAY